jgi:Mn-dependent DtxR family transcriptional regulator
MLELLLAEIRQGGSLETNALATRLGTPPKFVAAMLEHLQRIGLVQDYVNCTEGCGGCRLQADCNSKKPIRLWQSAD